jgi:hypothetical protein
MEACNELKRTLGFDDSFSLKIVKKPRHMEKTNAWIKRTKKEPNCQKPICLIKGQPFMDMYNEMKTDISNLKKRISDLETDNTNLKRRISDLENANMFLNATLRTNGIILDDDFTTEETMWLLALRQSMNTLLKTHNEELLTNGNKSSKLQQCLTDFKIDIDSFIANCENRKNSAYSFLCDKIAHPKNERVKNTLPKIPEKFSGGIKKSHFDQVTIDEDVFGRKEINDIIKVNNKLME